MNSNHARTILHIDLDCFYCQVEQKRLGISPNVPVAVQQWEGLIAINYPARAAGITRHMRVHEAKALCPELQCVHVETIGGDELDTKDRTKQKACLERYRKACIQILAVLHKAAPQAIIEKASIDEVYMDVTTMVEKELRERAQADSCKNPEAGEGGAHDWEAGGSPVDAFAWGSIVLGGGPLDVGSEFERRLSIGANIACRLRGAIREQLGFTCSAGIAANKLLAKVASAMNKPNQQTIVPPRAVDAMMADLPLKKLRNFGGKLGAELSAMGCTTAGQVAAIPHGQLSARFGEERAASIARAVRGYSDEPVQVKELAKSMLAAKSFNATSSPAELDRWMGILAEELAHRLTEDGTAHSRAPRGLTLSYRGSNGDRSKCGPAPRPAKDGYTVEVLKEAGSMLLRKCPDIYPCARLALQANDFYDLPLGDDQGAISRFFTSGATGTRDMVGEGGAPATLAAPKAKKTGPQQASIAQMFKRAAAASSCQAEEPGAPSNQAENAATTPAQPSAQDDALQIAKGSEQASQDGKTSQLVQQALSSQGRQEDSASYPVHDHINDPAHPLQGVATRADVPGHASMEQPPNACTAVDASEHGASVDTQPDCDLASVDIEEQKRIMHEIWMKSRGSASRIGEDDVRNATSAAADRSAKRGAAGSAVKEGAGKQMRISAMFKTPRRT
ncbi:g10563 [Coccomyxa elongata]